MHYLSKHSPLAEILARADGDGLFIGGLRGAAVDSMPIVLAKGPRSGVAKTAGELANKGYCASKGMYYYGVKFHQIGLLRRDSLPRPGIAGLSPAAEHDSLFSRSLSGAPANLALIGDKAYSGEDLRDVLAVRNVKLLTPFKKAKGGKGQCAFEKLFSTAVSKVRQPVEAFFFWFQEKTNVQTASKVRSLKGLMIHVFARYATVLYEMAEAILFF